MATFNIGGHQPVRRVVRPAPDGSARRRLRAPTRPRTGSTPAVPIPRADAGDRRRRAQRAGSAAALSLPPAGPRHRRPGRRRGGPSGEIAFTLGSVDQVEALLMTHGRRSRTGRALRRRAGAQVWQRIGRDVFGDLAFGSVPGVDPATLGGTWEELTRQAGLMPMRRATLSRCAGRAAARSATRSTARRGGARRCARRHSLERGGRVGVRGRRFAAIASTWRRPSAAGRRSETSASGRGAPSCPGCRRRRSAGRCRTGSSWSASASNGRWRARVSCW